MHDTAEHNKSVIVKRGTHFFIIREYLKLEIHNKVKKLTAITKEPGAVLVHRGFNPFLQAVA